MPRKIGQQTAKDLNAKQIAAIKTQGYHRASDRLYVQVTGRGAKSWICRVTYNHNVHDIGLGPIDLVTLAQAKDRVIDIRRQIAAGHDPLAGRTPRSLGAASIMAGHIFREVAEDYITKNQAGWKGKTASIWRSMLSLYTFPVIGDLNMDGITVGHIEEILLPIWTTKNTTADSVRDRIRRVWDAARVRGWCSGQNPAQWGGNLSAVLPAPRKVHKTSSHASLPYADLPALMAELRAKDGMALRCLEFAILTGGRSDEARSAMWSEIDLEAATWRIPAGRMKAGEKHDVPLSDAAMALLRALPTDGHLVFGKLGHDAMRQALGKFGRNIVVEDSTKPITVHGFRATFNMWGTMVGKFPQIVLDLSIAHKQQDKVLAAYQRGGSDVDAERRRAMNEWAAYCG